MSAVTSTIGKGKPLAIATFPPPLSWGIGPRAPYQRRQCCEQWLRRVCASFVACTLDWYPRLEAKETLVASRPFPKFRAALLKTMPSAKSELEEEPTLLQYAIQGRVVTTLRCSPAVTSARFAKICR